MTTKDFQNRGLLQIFLSYFKPHRRLFALDMTCAFLIAVVDLAFPLVSRTALYTWLPEKQFRVFFVVMALVVAAYVLRSGLYFVVAYWGHTFGIRVEADIRRDLYHHMQELGFDFYDKNRTGQLMSRLTSDLFEVTELAHHGPEDLFISLVTIVGALIVMFCIRWELALVLLVMLPVLLLAALTCVIGLLLVIRPSEAARALMVLMGISLLLDGILNMCVAWLCVKIVRNQRPDALDEDYEELKDE